jgi:hypothetical protein
MWPLKGGKLFLFFPSSTADATALTQISVRSEDEFF